MVGRLLSLLRGAPTGACPLPGFGFLSVGSNTSGGGSGPQHSQRCEPIAVASPPVAATGGQGGSGPAPSRPALATTTADEWRDQVIAVMDAVHGSAARQPHRALGKGPGGAGGQQTDAAHAGQDPAVDPPNRPTSDGVQAPTHRGGTARRRRHA